jgi:hypothetical protein
VQVVASYVEPYLKHFKALLQHPKFTDGDWTPTAGRSGHPVSVRGRGPCREYRHSKSRSAKFAHQERTFVRLPEHASQLPLSRMLLSVWSLLMGAGLLHVQDQLRAQKQVSQGRAVYCLGIRYDAPGMYFLGHVLRESP